jgi:hypothetical protein
MLGQAYNLKNNKYNIVILAAGASNRMGNASNFIPKALSKIGNKRAINYLIEKYKNIAYKFVIGVGYHRDLLEYYLKGVYNNLNIEFSYQKPEDLKNNGVSTIYCLDHCDSRYETIILFCDLFIFNNCNVLGDSLYFADIQTEGNIGTFRHTLKLKDNSSLLEIVHNDPPVSLLKKDDFGILGQFDISNTPLFKSIAYTKFNTITDITTDIIIPYSNQVEMQTRICKKVFEFGNETDLQIVRNLWEQS